MVFNNTQLSVFNGGTMKLQDVTTLSREEAQRQLEAIAKQFPELTKKKTERKRIIKVTEKGGLFISDPTMVAKSKAGREYIAGVNVHSLEAAKALFLNDVLLAEVKMVLSKA
jgi:hypothetical protein